jgi:phage anti-repressor protein
MELEILVSKKGTRVVKASELFIALGLPEHHFGQLVRKWLNDIYEFRDGIRAPESMKDYAIRPVDAPVQKDYFLSIELAKQIALKSTSKNKQKIAIKLAATEDAKEYEGYLSAEQVLAVIELTKVMGLVSCQLASEQQHHRVYETRNHGNPANWWNFRKNIFGYSTEDLRKILSRQGFNGKSKSQRQLLMHFDKYEMIRVAVIDLFMAMGKTEEFSRMIGDMSKVFAKELNIEIFDDRNAALALLPNVNQELVNEIRSLNVTTYSRRWENLKMAS